MAKDNLEGNVRSAIGQGEKIIGQAVGDKAVAAQGAYDHAAGKAQSALGSAKDAVNEGVNAVSHDRLERPRVPDQEKSLGRGWDRGPCRAADWEDGVDHWSMISVESGDVQLPLLAACQEDAVVQGRADKRRRRFVRASAPQRARGSRRRTAPVDREG
jgi:uncharacterized protein YjbJ (UPF0337 family)